MNVADPTEKHPRNSRAVAGGVSSSMLYLVWAICGGFILHFLLSNYLSVLLRPNYEKPVETAADIVNRDITPFYASAYFKTFFAASPDPVYQELGEKLVTATTWEDHYMRMVKTVTEGSLALLGKMPYIEDKYLSEISEDENQRSWMKRWYRSTEHMPGMNPYGVHLTSRKWPLKKVRTQICMCMCNIHFDNLEI